MVTHDRSDITSSGLRARLVGLLVAGLLDHRHADRLTRGARR